MVSGGDDIRAFSNSIAWLPTLYVSSISWGLTSCSILSLLSAGRPQPVDATLLEPRPRGALLELAGTCS